MDALEQELVKDSIVSLNERGCIHWSVALRYAVSANEVYSYSLSIWWQLAALLGIRVDAVFGTSIGVLMLDCSSSVNKKKKWNKVFSRWLFYTPLSLQSKIWEMKRFKSGESQIAVGCNNHLCTLFFFLVRFGNKPRRALLVMLHNYQHPRCWQLQQFHHASCLASCNASRTG